MRVKLDDVPLSRKFWLTVVGLLLALLAVTQWTQARLRAADEAAAQRLAQQQDVVSLVSAWITASLGSTNASMAALASSEPAVVKLMQERLQAASSAGDEMEARVQQSVTTDADHQAMAEIVQRRNVVKDLLKQGAALKAHDATAVQDFIAAQLWPAVQARQAAMQALLAVQSRERDEVKAAAEAERQSVISGGLLRVAVVAGLSLLWTGLLLRSIHRPLQAAVELAEAVAAGDLAQGATESRRDEIGRLLQAMSEMAGRLRLVVTDVRSGVGSVATASAQIAAGNLDLSHRTESTAGNLQQTVASLEQLSGTVVQTADVAQQASQLADAAAQSAQRGGAVAAEVVGSMDRIAEAARRIADITGVIDAIAFQTNILALNAAVEAARAGEQGRGFAVVAGEVRTLAQRSATAAREIKQLIAHSGEAVAIGARQVCQSREVMAEIVAKVGNVSTLIGEMARASDQGRVGIRQVSEAVDAIDRMTQQNAALVEQSSAAAVSLRDQAARLSDAVAVFRVEAQPA